MRTRGRVFADRYHAHVLRTPTEVLHALRYVRSNFAVHAARRGQHAPAVDAYSSAALVEGSLPHEQDGPLVAAPRTWLLTTGWRRAPRALGAGMRRA